MGGNRLAIILISSILHSACNSDHKAAFTHPEPYHTRPGISGLLNGYLKTLSGNEESRLLRNVYNNPFKGEHIETALNMGIDPSKIYRSIEFGLIQQNEQTRLKIDEIRRSGVKESSDQFQQLLWTNAKTGFSLKDVIERELEVSRSSFWFTERDIQWYMGTIEDGE